MYPIQDVLLASDFLVNSSDLFVKKQFIPVDKHDISLSYNILYSFNTYFNVFQAKNWFKYCTLSNLFLNLSGVGKCRIQIIGSNLDYINGICNTILFETFFNSDISDSISINIASYEDFICIYFNIIVNNKDYFILNKAMWCTENKQKYNKKIAYVICTYKREEYVKKNVEIFSKFIIDNPDLAEFFHLYIIDNGKTLDIESNTNKYISVFHNLNSGGAGGFTRGIIEVMKSKEKDYDNIILMDDDGLLFPESLKRTLCLINYLKEQYKSFFINGVFLNLYDTNSLLGQFSVQNQENMRPKNLYGQLDLSEYSNILQISEPLDVDYIRKVYNNITCTWGYCCFPVNIIETNGLPLPLFIYGDDVEFSWRNKKANIIMLNGIAFWHRPVSFARNTINYRFFAQRNIIILNILYGRNFHIKIKKFLKSYFFDLLRTYDYIGIKLFLHALDDILRGDSMFDDDPENKLIKIYNIYNSYKLKITPYKFKSEFATPKLSKKQNLILSKLYKYSFYGLLVPNFLFKNVSISFGGNFNINCMFSKRILAINPVERTVQHRFFDRKLHIYYTYLFYRKLYAITKIYNKLRSEFINARKRTSTLIFWKNYLKLNNDEAQ